MTTAQQTYQMLGNQTLWDVARECHAALSAARVPYAVAGGVAVCLHGYRRNTVDLDLLISAAATALVRPTLESAGYIWSAEHAEFRSPSGIAVQLLRSADSAGAGSEVRLADPSDPAAVVEIEGLPVLSLAKLIESKIACGEGNLRRTHKDFADVVELIAQHELGKAFSRHLHKAVRPTFRRLVDQARA